MTYVTDYYAFFRYGSVDVGEFKSLKDVLPISFSEVPSGYGISISNIFLKPTEYLENFKEIKLRISSTEYLIFTVEFSTASRNKAANKTVKFEINEGENEILINISDNISEFDELIKVIFNINKDDNEGLKAEIKIDEIILE